MNKRIKKKLNNRQNFRTYEKYETYKKFQDHVWKDLNFSLQDLKNAENNLIGTAERYNLQKKWHLIFDNILAKYNN